MAKILDTLTIEEQKQITCQFQSRCTLGEIQKFLDAEHKIEVTTRTIRNWFADRGIKRIFFDDDMADLKQRQASEKRAIQASTDRWTRLHLITMIDDRVLTGEQVADMIMKMRPEMVEAAWEDYMYKQPQNRDESSQPPTAIE